MAYTSLVPYIHLLRFNLDQESRVVDDDEPAHRVIYQSTPPSSITQETIHNQTVVDLSTEQHDYFGLYCCKFSGDGRELLAGSNDASLYLYDITAGKTVHRIQGHDNDVNSVAFIDPLDSNVILSASDDCFIKV